MAQRFVKYPGLRHWHYLREDQPTKSVCGKYAFPEGTVVVDRAADLPPGAGENLCSQCVRTKAYLKKNGIK